MTALFKAWVCGSFLDGTAVSIPDEGNVCVVSSQVEVSASGLLLAQRSPTDCGASDEGNSEAPQGGGPGRGATGG